MSANNSTCHTFSEREVDAIFTTRVIVATLSLTTCLFTLLMLSAMVCCLRVWKTFVHRLKLYLTAVAPVLSVMYLLQVLPTRSRITETDNLAWSRRWNVACEAVAFILQYVDWLLLLFICWIIVYLLRISFRIGRNPTIFNNTHSQKSKYLEIAGLVLTLIFPLLFVWAPFVTKSYGLTSIWCGIIINPNCTYDRSHYSNEVGLGYLIGLWYAPAAAVALLCTVGVIIVIAQFWIYYKKRGLTRYMSNAIVKGIPPITYLVLYNTINCIDILNIIYHNVVASSRRVNEVDFRLWMVHAITGPARAFTIPFAFVLSHVFIRCCFREAKTTRRDSYHSLQ